MAYKKRKRHSFIIPLLCLSLIGIGTYIYHSISQSSLSSQSKQTIQLKDIPKYTGKPYVVLQNNKPNINVEELHQRSFERYSRLDALGRCGVAVANIGTETMPDKKRESISDVRPSGWHNKPYKGIDGRYLYNRCHLIGYQLTGENANKRNLITGTRYFNVEGMLPFENMVTDYIKRTRNHVLYRVTPLYEGRDLVAKGVIMEAMSDEDHGKGIQFCVFVYNVQPGIHINYHTGDSYATFATNMIFKRPSEYNSDGLLSYIANVDVSLSLFEYF